MSRRPALYTVSDMVVKLWCHPGVLDILSPPILKMGDFSKVLSLFDKIRINTYQDGQEREVTAREEDLLRAVVQEASRVNGFKSDETSFWDALSSSSISPQRLVSFCNHMFQGSTSSKFNAAKLYLSLWALEGSSVYSIFNVSSYRSSLNTLKMFTVAHDTQGVVSKTKAKKKKDTAQVR